MTDTHRFAQLRKLACAACRDYDCSSDERAAKTFFQQAATPSAILAMLDEIDRLQDITRSLGAGALAEALMPWIDRLQPVAPPAGQEVSIDISTGDHDYDRRAFGKLTGEVNHSGIGDVWLAEGYVNQPIDIARIRAEAVAEERERIAAWIEPQRRDIPGHGWEFAAAIRASANEAPR